MFMIFSFRFSFPINVFIIDDDDDDEYVCIYLCSRYFNFSVYEQLTLLVHIYTLFLLIIIYIYERKREN